MNLDRRTVLIGGGAGIGLVIAYALWPGGMGGPLERGPGDGEFGAFIKINRAGTVTVAVPQVETGQGIWTALPQVVADELGAAWETIAVEPAPPARVYANAQAGKEGWFDGLGLLRTFEIEHGSGGMLTAGSSSVRSFARPMREAAATARAMLIAEAASRLDVNPADCAAAAGRVTAAGRSVEFGDLAEGAARRRPPGLALLRGGKADRLTGQPLPRLDARSKSSGKFRFAGDVRLPDMLHASVRMAPLGGRLSGFEQDSASGRDGVRHVAARGDWIAVAADSWFVAESALHAANPRFQGPAGWPEPRAAFEAALRGTDGTVISTIGDVEPSAGGRRPVAATYYVAPFPNLLPEPLSATARWTNGAAELWSGTQAPGLSGSAVRDKNVTAYPMPIGGASGRIGNRLEAIALDLAAELKRPVQVTIAQSRAHWASPSSPGMMVRLAAVQRDDGFPLSWEARVATAPGLGAEFARLADAPTPALDALALGGIASPYAIENVRVTGIDVRPPFATGYVRGSPEREAVFAIESFIDELARRMALEPLAYRMAMLGADPRLARCFQSAAALAEWDGGGRGSSMGIAGASAFGSAIALVATASIGPDQQVAAHKLVAAVDCGETVNPALAAQQVEAAILWALNAAGSSRASLSALPEIEVHFLPSESPPGGLSGLGILPVAPAIASAIHAATGRRMRSLPFDPMAA